MCGRFTLHTEKELLARRFQVDSAALPPLEARYNIAPTDPVLVVRNTGERRVAETMRWGFRPGEARSKRAPLINARAETLARRPAYARAYRERRCLILADGFYEWGAASELARAKTPYWISLASGEPFAMAGLWEESSSGADPALLGERRCTIVTVPATARIAPIHDRMPLILSGAAESAWLDPNLKRPDELQALLIPLPDEALSLRPVSRRVNSVRNDGPDLIQLWDEPSLGF